jgi:hypothetical protein
MSEDCQKTMKKSYLTPTLTTYGDVRKITEATGMTGAQDHGGGAATKTSLP